MSKLHSYLAAATASLIATSLLAAGPSPQSSGPLQLPPGAKLQPFKIVGAFWRTDHGFFPQITLKNVVETAPVSVTAVLYAEDGTVYPLPAVTLPASGVKTIDIRSAIGASPADVRRHFTEFGSAEIDYQWYWSAAVLAQISNIDSSRSLSYMSDFQLPPAAPKPDNSQANVAQGLWWLYNPDVQPFLRLTNTSAESLNAVLSASTGQAASSPPLQLTLPAQGTALMQLRSLLPPGLTAGSNGSVRVEYQGPPNALAVDGGLEEEKTGFSAVLPVRWLDPNFAPVAAQPHVVTLGTAGLMIGRPDKMMNFPAATVFSVYMVVENVSNHGLTVSPKIFYEQSGSNRNLSLTSLELQPGEVRQVPVSAALAANRLSDLTGSVNLALSYTGQEADLLATSGSVDQTGTYVLESYFETELPSSSRSLCYWNTASGTDTMYSIWNYTENKENMVFRLHFEGGTYEIPLSLPAGGTYMLDLKDLIMEAKPDRNGRQIPAGVQEGSAKLESEEGDKGTLHVVVSGATYNVRTATCVFRCINCNGASSYYILPGPFWLDLPGTLSGEAEATWNTGTQYNYTGSSTWSSSNTQVATVSTGQVSSVAAGSANIASQSPTLPRPGQVCSYNVPVCNIYIRFQATQPAHVIPTLSSTTLPLWYLGPGVTTRPSTFIQGDVQAIITASGASGGSFSWSVSNPSELSFSSTGSQATAVTSTNSVTVYTIGPGASRNDVEVSLTWTDPTGYPEVPAPLSFTIDSPYSLTLISFQPPAAVSTCGPPWPPPSGNIGNWSQYFWQMVSYFQQVINGLPVNENFTNLVNNQTNNYPPTPNGSPGQTNVSTFTDNYCFANQIAAKPPSLPPQTPLGTSLVWTAHPALWRWQSGHWRWCPGANTNSSAFSGSHCGFQHSKVGIYALGDFLASLYSRECNAG